MGELHDRKAFLERLNEQVVQGLELWLESRPWSIKFLRWIDGGRSGAQVAAVIRSGHGTDDQVIVKFSAQGAQEVRQWRQAINDSPREFRKRHLGELVEDHPLSDQKSTYVVVLKVAGGDWSRIRPIVELIGEQSLPDVCDHIVSSIVIDWNTPRVEKRREQMKVGEYLREIVGNDRHPRNKRLHAWAESVGVSPHRPIIENVGDADRLLPNPLALLSKPEVPGAETIHILRGRAHGDLNVRNILLPIVSTRMDEYILVDLGGYTSDAALTRDPMHFLLSISMEWLLHGITPGSPKSHLLMNAIVSPAEDAPSPIAQGYHDVSRAVNKAGYGWACQDGWGAEWTGQRLLSLTGCALQFAGRKLPVASGNEHATRKWFFDLAAVAARAYLDHTGGWRDYLTRSNQSALSGLRSAEPRCADRHACETGGIDNSDATIYYLPVAGEPISQTTSTPPDSDDQGEAWSDLVLSLRQATFDSTNWRMLVAGSHALRAQLAQRRPSHPTADEQTNAFLQDLNQTLSDAAKPSVTPAELRAACAHAERLRQWLLDLLAEHRR